LVFDRARDLRRVALRRVRVPSHRSRERTDGRLVVRLDVVDPHRRTGPVRAHPAGLHDRDADAQRPDLLREHLGKTSDGPLRGLVRRDPLRRAAPADRRDLDDVAGALLAEEWKRGARDVHDAEEVRLDLRAEIVLRDVFDRADVRVARVVDDDVEVAERGARHFGGSACGLGARDVEPRGAYAVAELLDERLKVLRVAGRGDETIAICEDRLRDFEPEPARATRD
jgi:hypothetical protein